MNIKTIQNKLYENYKPVPSAMGGMLEFDPQVEKPKVVQNSRPLNASQKSVSNTPATKAASKRQVSTEGWSPALAKFYQGVQSGKIKLSYDDDL